MRRIALLLCLLVGCDKPDFGGRCTIEKSDGVVTSVKVNMPHHPSGRHFEFTCTKRKEMDKLIDGLESLILDLKAARDRMPVIEQKE
jgi:hypothetical protein